MSHDITRREFVGRAIAAGAGAAALGVGPAEVAAQTAKPRVIGTTRAAATKDMEPNAAVVKAMVDDVVMKLSGKPTPAEAWAMYVKPHDVVGIKVNCLFGPGASTHAEVTDTVVAGCRAAGVPADNIIVWDREDKHLLKTGYEVNRGKGVKVYGVGQDWEDDPVDIHDCKGRLAQVLTQTCTALINVPILKSHGIAGITASMKNHYGSFHNPWDAHKPDCDPYVAHLNSLPAIREKTRLLVCDALLPVAEGGPRARPEFTYVENAILAATDPVALDSVGLRMLDAQRAKMDLPSIEESGKARHIFTAAARGLGVADPEGIDLVSV